MNKDFDSWNSLKKKIHYESSGRFYHEREIWWCSVGINVGFEQDGKGIKSERPVIILKAFNKHLCWALPLSTVNKKNRYYFPVGKIGKADNFAIISQLRPLDTRRLTNHVGYINQVIFNQIKKTVKDLL